MWDIYGFWNAAWTPSAGRPTESCFKVRHGRLHDNLLERYYELSTYASDNEIGRDA